MSLNSLMMIVLTGVANVSDSQNLFSEEWTEGNLHTIEGIVEKLGGFACTVISFVGFAIVIFSILKNALSGLYVVNPTFWDKVDQIKKDAVGGITSGIQGATGGNQATQKLGSVLTFILSLIPNIKDLTDFAEDENGTTDPRSIDKKQYFTKSLLMLIAQIFIGMLIFFGYPSKIANWIGTGATYAIGVVLENANPVEFISGFSDKFVDVNLSTDGSPIKLEQNINQAARSASAAVKTKYSDMKKESAQTVAQELESFLIGVLTEQAVGDILGAQEGYNFSIDCVIMENIPTVSSAFSPIDGSTSNNAYFAIATDGTRSYRIFKPVTDLSTGSVQVGANDYVVWTINATPAAVSSIASTRAVIFGGYGTATISASQAKIPVNGISYGTDDGMINGKPGSTVSITVYEDASSTQPVGTYKGKIESSIGSSAGEFTLIMSQGDYETAKNAKIWDVVLTGSWSMQNTDGNKHTTYTVTKLRLTNGVTSGSAALTSWSNFVDLAGENGVMTTSGVDTKALITKSNLDN